MSAASSITEPGTHCYHCGQPCEETIWVEDKAFCCHGCKTVYEILSAGDLCEYYTLDKTPGTSMRKAQEETYAYLEEKEIRKQLLTFDSDTFARVSFYVPAIHCVSCIWLLENLQKLQAGVLRSEVNFARKTVRIDFNPTQVTLSAIAAVMASIGYTPRISLQQEEPSTKHGDHALIFKLAVAGFCFGNVMLFSFPEYLGIDASEVSLKHIFSWLNVALSIPVLLYSGSDYFRSALSSFRHRHINLDVPIAIGLVTLFSRSLYDIITLSGSGYLDSFTGLVFFLLIGRWFQSKTYESLAFDRDFKSYFPLAIHKLVNHEWKPVVIYNLEKGDQIRLRNLEIVPADSILTDEEALIDYSFVTGESKPVSVREGERIYAGGRLVGKSVTLVVEKKTSQSHLTSLWNHEAFQKASVGSYNKVIDRAARIFTWAVLAIALGTAAYWYTVDPSRMWLILTAVLIVACPCALALTAPFTYGNMLRVFGRYHFYLKNADVIEKMATIDTVVFDKTGTVTHGQDPEVDFTGSITPAEAGYIKTLTIHSTHPLSTLINRSLKVPATETIFQFKELPGKGIEGTIEGHPIRIGSAAFVGYQGQTDRKASTVFVSVDQTVKGYFSVKTSVRPSIASMLHRLGVSCGALLSGDNETDRAQMEQLFPVSAQLCFNLSPYDKMDYIQKLRLEGRHVMMVGDGLNDAGALKNSDVGIAITDDTGVFTPACDGILQGDRIGQLDKFLRLAARSKNILRAGFAISFLYNAVAIAVAGAGLLTPLTAAILMPLSSISVVAFSTLAVNLAARTTLRNG